MHLVIPYASARSDAAVQALGTLSLPNLERLLGRWAPDPDVRRLATDQVSGADQQLDQTEGPRQPGAVAGPRGLVEEIVVEIVHHRATAPHRRVGQERWQQQAQQGIPAQRAVSALARVRFQSLG